MAAVPERRPDAEDDLPALDDPVIMGLMERAVAPYRAVLPAEARRELEQLLWMILATHPEVAPMVDRLRREAAEERSGTRRRRDTPPGGPKGAPR
jgi:hypothetical protein